MNFSLESRMRAPHATIKGGVTSFRGICPSLLPSKRVRKPKHFCLELDMLHEFSCDREMGYIPACLVTNVEKQSSAGAPATQHPFPYSPFRFSYDDAMEVCSVLPHMHCPSVICWDCALLYHLFLTRLSFPSATAKIKRTCIPC